MLLYRPCLFAAQGAGFTNKSADGALEQVYPGIHIRCFNNPKMGLMNGYEGVNEPSLLVYRIYDGISVYTQKDLSVWEGKDMYDIHTLSNMVPGKERKYVISQETGLQSFCFERSMSSVFGPGFSMAMSYMGHDLNELDYLRDVIRKVINFEFTNNTGWMVSDVCALDIQAKDFRALPLFTMMKKKSGKNVRMTIKGYDCSGRLVAEDWIGEQLRWTIKKPGFGLPICPRVIKKDKAVLRAPGIARIEVKGTLEIEKMWWIYTEEYLENRKISLKENGRTGMFWEVNGQGIYYALTPSNTFLTPQYAYAPFHQATLPNFSKIVANIFDQKEGLVDVINSLIANGSTYEAWSNKAPLDDIYNGHNESGSQKIIGSMSKMEILSMAALDPLVSRLMGTYYYKSSSDLKNDHGGELVSEKGDFKVVWKRPVFFRQSNREKMHLYCMGDNKWLEEITLCGLVMGMEDKIDKALPEVIPPLKFELNSNPSGGSNEGPGSPEYKEGILVNSTLSYVKPEIPTKPYTTPVAYTTKRGIKKETDASYSFSNISEYEDPGASFNMIGIIPPSVISQIDEKDKNLCRISDFFKMDVAAHSFIKYALTCYDMFARKGHDLQTDGKEVALPCYPPPPPTGAIMFVEKQASGSALLNIKFVSPKDPNDIFAAKPEYVEIEFFKSSVGGTWESPSLSSKFFAESFHIDLSSNNITWNTCDLKWTGSPPDAYVLTESALSVTVPSGQLPDPATALYTSFYEGNGEKPGYEVTRNFRTIQGIGSGDHTWCARLRTKGTSITGVTKYSRPVWLKGKLGISLPPPVVNVPEYFTVPESTYPDSEGNSYYTIDLSTLGLPGNSAVNVYLCRADIIWEGTDGFDAGTLITGAPGVAHANKTGFNKVNEQPVVYDVSGNRYFSIKVRGDLQKYFIAVITGVSLKHQEESDWQDSAVFIFKTPRKMVFPVLNYSDAQSVIEDGQLLCKLRYYADFDAIPGTAPKIQIMKKDETISGNVSYYDEIEGLSDAETAGRYVFDVSDENVIEWHRYSYSATLLDLRDGIYLRSAEPKRVVVDCAGDGSDVLLGMDILPNLSPGKTTMLASFKAGEFSFSIMKIVNKAVEKTIRGRVTQGKLGEMSGLDEGASLDIVMENAVAGKSFCVKYSEQGLWNNNVSCVFRLNTVGSDNAYSWKAVHNV